jgi:geranylgeranyl diphosphate synthase type II
MTAAGSFSLDAYLTQQASRVERLLAARMEALAPNTPPKLLESMRYSLLAGGKRLRPVLALAFGEAVRPELREHPSRVLEDAACSLEYVHTYSLVHDDLPAMDDDDLRRGLPTNHKVFGEGMAILAGDALLTEAFALVADGEEPPRRALVRDLAVASGAIGMVGGQVLDVAEDRPAELGYLRRLHRLKTGALIRAACRMGVIAAGGTLAQLEAATHYGEAVGLAFQIADDLLDVTADPKTLGKPTQADAAAGRHTFPAILGMDGSNALAREQVNEALQSAKTLEPQPGPLAALAHYSVERKQ